MDNKLIQNLYNNKNNISKSDKKGFINILNKIDHIDDNRNKYNEMFYIYIADSEMMRKIFIIVCVFIYLCTKKDLQLKYVGIDFEFNNHIVGLMQININNIISNKVKYIWLIDLNEFNKNDKSIIVKTIFLNDYLYKILHGSDSLDTPFIFENLLSNDKEKILKFIHRLIDTRFICEYIRSDRGELPKCSIYDALKYFDTIDSNKYISLNNINEMMGPTYKIKWNVHNLNFQQIRYAYYDVLFLDSFLIDMYNNIDDKNMIYYKYINEIIRFIFLERRQVSNIIQKAKINVTKLNNIMIDVHDDKHDDKYTLTKLFDMSHKKVIIKDGDKSFDMIKLIDNNYVKSMFIVLLKHIFYEKVTGEISSNYIYRELDKLGFDKIKKILIRYSKVIKFKNHKINL